MSVKVSKMMIRRICFSSYQRQALCLSSQNGNRKLSAEAAISYKPKGDEYENAIPFDQIPGLSKFELIKRFMPGGQFSKMSIIDIQKSLRAEFGDLVRLPGMFGQTTTVTTFDADDIEFIHRNEGTYPYRRGLDTMKHFRQNIRSDVYSVGGLIIE